MLGLKTRTARLRRAITSVNEFCRSRRHEPVEQQHAGLCRRLNGHLNYFALNGNSKSVSHLIYWAARLWRKWLDRRSQRGRMKWARFGALLQRFPLPRPTVRVVDMGAGEVRRTQRGSRMVEISSSGSGEGPGERKHPGLLD
jgi:hypothetical protein